MKKMLFTLVTMLTIAASANAMSYEQARNEALFLTDKMAYELNLSDAQYEAAYEINLDYLMGVTSYDDVFGVYWERRNLDLSYILYQWQWDAFRAASYFYRPLYWDGGYWHFGIYARYPHRDYLYFGHPHFYVSYRGGHSWRFNGGRSYYEGRHDHFRPHVSRDHHVGMRNSWDRGDYRHSNGRSSTRLTDRTGRRSDSNRGNGNGNYGNNGSNHGNGNYGNNGSNHGNGNYGNGNGTHHNSGNNGSFGGNRNSNSTYGSPRGTTGSSSNSVGSSSQGRFSSAGSSSSSHRGYSTGSSSSSSNRVFSGSSVSRGSSSVSRGSSSVSRGGSMSRGSSGGMSRGSSSVSSGSSMSRGSSSGSSTGGHSRSGGGRR